MSAAQSVSAPFSTLTVFALSLQRKTEPKQKRGEGRGKEKGRRRTRRRNSLVKEFKWNDEKKLEGRTG